MKRPRWLKGEGGLQTLEWVALGLVILALLGAVVAYLNGPGGPQVAAPINQVLQQYAWCLEGYASCGWGGNAGAPGIGRPGAGLPGGSQPGVNPPGGSQPGVNLPASKSMKPWEWAWWCVTHPGECAQDVGKWAQDRWEGVKRTAQRVVDTLRSGVEAVWNWANQNKGLVAGFIITALIAASIVALVLAGVALSPLAIAAGVGAAAGALLFGYIFDRSIPPDQRTWGGAFLFVIQGAVLGGLAGAGIASLFTQGIAVLIQLIATKGAIGGVASVISYMINTPFDEWSLVGIGSAFVIGLLTEIVANSIMSAAIDAIANTIQGAQKGNLRTYTPMSELVKSLVKGFFKERMYDRSFGRLAGRLIGGRKIGTLGRFGLRIANRVSFDAVSNFVSSVFKGPR